MCTRTRGYRLQAWAQTIRTTHKSSAALNLLSLRVGDTIRFRLRDAGRVSLRLRSCQAPTCQQASRAAVALRDDQNKHG
jgi:hypothetical protein